MFNVINLYNMCVFFSIRENDSYFIERDLNTDERSKSMDFGLLICFIIFIAYCTGQYKKTKKSINIILIIYVIALGVYGTRFPIYNHLDKLQQNVVNVAFVLFTLGLLAILFINRIKRKGR